MPNVYVEIYGQEVPNPAPEGGDIVITSRAWYGAGLNVSVRTVLAYADTSNQMNNKLRADVVAACGREGVTVTQGDKVILGGNFSAL